MTDLRKHTFIPRLTRAERIFFRVLSGAAGVAAILAGTVLPVAYIMVMDSAWGFLLALGFAGLCGLAAYLLISFAIKGPKSG